MSYEINLRIGAKASPEKAFEALTRPEKLAQWWTPDTRGSGTKVGDTLEFWFGEFCEKFDVTALEPGRKVAWKAPKGQGAAEWEGTEVTCTLSKDDKQTFVRFKHSGWRENGDFHAHCSTRWAVFLVSLKELLETGKGRPIPNDVRVDY
jgi:uncharacterized protein YndB with AHSA1/START domain